MRSNDHEAETGGPGVEYERRLTIFSVMPAIQLFIGLWVLASMYFLQFTIYEAPRHNAGIVGPMVIMFALTRLAVNPPWFWVGWINALFGIWLIISPFAFGLTHVTDMTVSFIVAGALLTITSVLGQFEKAEERSIA